MGQINLFAVASQQARWLSVRQSAIAQNVVGEVKGYIIAQFVFTMDGSVLRQLSVPPDVFIIDDAYRVIYANGQKVDFRNLDKVSIDAMTKEIAAKVNERFKSDLVKDVLVEQFNYLSKEEVRANTLNVVKK